MRGLERYFRAALSRRKKHRPGRERNRARDLPAVLNAPDNSSPAFSFIASIQLDRIGSERAVFHDSGDFHGVGVKRGGLHIMGGRLSAHFNAMRSGRNPGT